MLLNDRKYEYKTGIIRSRIKGHEWDKLEIKITKGYHDVKEYYPE